MAQMQKRFRSFFKYCPDCGTKFVYNEDTDMDMCYGCKTHAFKIMNRYYGKFMNLRREHYREYHHGD